MIIGHKAILDDLKKLADRGALSHSYLFFGPAMVGKKMAARELAGYLEKIENGGRRTQDGGHRTEREEGSAGGILGMHSSDLDQGNHQTHQAKILSDTLIIEPGEGGSIGIDAVRDIKNFLWQKPNASPRRTLIINDAELLTAEAQNALLKITEEPPASALLILVTSDAESLMPTILSRFQKIYFGLVPGLEKKAMGKPGLAWRIMHDEDFRAAIELAEKFLKSAAGATPLARRDLIKKIIEPEDFDLRKFLDMVIMVLGWEMENGKGNLGARNNGKDEKNGKSGKTQIWHKTLALYERQTNFSLNPRLQLENLLA